MHASPDSIEILNRLVVLHNRSLPTYLGYASPTWHRGDDRARATLATVVAQQQEMVDRLGSVIVAQGGIVDYGAFPMSFTGYHDLSFAFLLTKLIEWQQRDVKAIEQCVAELEGDPRAKEIAQEALGLAKGHLEMLTELQEPTAAAS